MIAFSFFGWPIYRYGLFYLCSFMMGYIYLGWISKQKGIQDRPKIQGLLINNLDNLMIALILGVMIGGRLGDVFLYNWVYYSQHLDQIIALWNGGMSFIGGFVGVALSILIIKNTYKLSWKDIFVLFDIIVFFLPVAIILGRIGNGLNQELYGKVVNIADYMLFYKLHIIRIYDLVDNQWRRNTNMMEGFFEGFLLLLTNIIVFGKKLVVGSLKPGMITGIFCILYSIVRFFLETLRDNPISEYRHGLLKSQLLMLGLCLIGVFVIVLSKKWTSKLDK